VEMERQKMKALFLSITQNYFAGSENFDCVATIAISSETYQLKKLAKSRFIFFKQQIKNHWNTIFHLLNQA